MAVHTHPTVPCPMRGFGSNPKIVKTFESFVGEGEDFSDDERKELQKVGVIEKDPVVDRFYEFLSEFNSNPLVKVHLDALKKIHEELMDKHFTEEDYSTDWVEDGPSYSTLVDDINKKDTEEVTLAEWLLLNG